MVIETSVEDISILKIQSKKLNILHLEDLQSDAFLIADTLKKANITYEVLVVDTKQRFINALNEFSPDIILADHSLPSFNSHEALEIFKQTGKVIPFILVTAAMSDEFAVDIIKRGADDYILKDRLGRLPVAITNSLEKFRLKKERQVFLNELINREKRYRALVENSTDAVVILDAESRPTYASPAFEHVLGYAEKELTHIDLFAIAYPGEVVGLTATMKQVLANPGLPIHANVSRLLHQNGKWKWLELTLTNLLDDSAINGIVAILRDITARKLAEEKIGNNEQRFRSLIDNSVDGMAILTADGKPLYVSPSIKNILGYDDEEAMQLDLFSMAHPNDNVLLVEMIECAMANPGVPINGKATRMLHKQGEWRWIEGSITNMLHHPAINGIVDNFRDVTERKLAEEKIMHLNRLYAFTSQINQAIVHATDEQTIFKEACQIAIKIGNFQAAWIGLWEPLEFKVKLLESSGLHPGEIAYFSEFEYEKDGPQDHVLNTGIYYVCNDIQQEKTLHNWKSLASVRGHGSAMILPIKKSGRIVGTFNLYATGADFFNKDEIALLQETTADISFSLDIFEKEKQRVQAEQRLKLNESRLKEAQAIGHLGSWELDLSTGICLWSEEMLSIYGLPPQDAIQPRDSWLSFVHPDDAAYVKGVTNEATSSLTNLAYFHRILKTDGAVRHVFTQAVFHFSSEGKPMGLHGVTHDITQMKEAEEALRESEKNLQAIFENTSEGFLLADVYGTIKAFNNKSRDFIFLNVQKEIKTGESIFDFIHESRRASYKKIIMSEVLTGMPFQYDYPYVRENGKTRWFNFSINPVYGAHGIDGLCITSVDITERKQSENSLRQSEAKYRKIVETAQEGIWLIDNNNRTTFVNKKMCEILEYSEEEMIGKENLYFTDDADKPLVIKMQERRRDGMKDNTELRFVTKTGKHIWTSISANPIFDDDANYIGALSMVSDITESKEVREKNKFQANLLNTIGQAAIATDINGVVNYWNKSAEGIYGWSRKEALGKNIVDLTPSYTSKEQALQIVEELSKGNTWSGQFKVKRKNGEDFPAFVTNSPFYDQHQKLAGIIGISSDISDKKKLEDLLDKASGMARIGNYERDLKKNTVYWSSMVREIHEVDSNYIPTLDAGINFYKEGPCREAMIKAYREAIEENIPFDLELQIVTAKGHERWVRIIGEVECHNGTSSRLYGSLQDIDKVKKAEFEVLKVYEERNIILESIADAFFAVDKKWTVTYWNKEAEKMLNTPKEVIINKTLWEVFSDSIDSPSYRNYHHAMETNEVVKFEDYYAAVHKWFEVNTYPSSTGLSVFFKDITERKLTEIRLNELNEQLQRHAKDLATSNKELEEFAYVASHDLQEPLRMVTSFLGQIDTKYNHLLDAKGKQYIHYAVDGAKRMRQIILDLLEFSRVGRMEEKEEHVDLNEVVNEIILLCQKRISETRAVINVEQLPVLQTYKAPLRQVFLNLISNALKYLKEGQPAKIGICAEETLTHWKFTIRDNGIGIEEQYFNKIFILFQRLHNKDEYSGTGIGLSVCKKIIENLGGKIWVESEWGHGTTFNFTLQKKGLK